MAVMVLAKFAPTGLKIRANDCKTCIVDEDADAGLLVLEPLGK